MGEVCVLAGTGELGFNGDGLPALETLLASPMSVRRDPDGRPVLVDFSNMRLRAVADDGTIETVVGSGMHAFSDIGAQALQTPLENPIDARWGPDGLLYIAPFHEGRVIRISAAGVVERVLGTGESLDHGGDGGDALDATMGYPGGVAFGDDGSLYVSDWTHSRVRRVREDGAIETVAGTGERGFDAAGFGPDVRLTSPTFLDVDAEGRLLIADSGNHRIARLDPTTLELRTVAGTGAGGTGGDGGAATSALLDQPIAVLDDPEGGFWISDSGNDVVRKVGADGTIETVVTDLETPAGLALSPTGALWIAERDGHRIVEWRRQ